MASGSLLSRCWPHSSTDQPVLVGAVAAAAGLPWQLTGLVAGSLADRVGARRLLPLADTVRVVVLAVPIALLVADRAGIAAVMVAAFLLGVAETVRDTAAEAVVPRLVSEEELEQAGGRLTAGSLIGNEFTGPLLGGFLFGAGAALPFIASSAATALAVLLVLTLPAAVLRLLTPLVAAEREADSGTERGFDGFGGSACWALW